MISTAEGGEAEVPLLDLWEFLTHLEWPLVGDNPFGVAYEQMHRHVARMTRQIEQERRLAPAQLAQLLARPHEERMAAVQGFPAATFSLAQLALTRSRELVLNDPNRALELAELGQWVADGLEVNFYGPERVSDLRALARAVLGNALRVAGELRGAGRAFDEARGCLATGSPQSVESVEVWELEISLLRDTEDFAGALALSTRILEVYESSGQTGRLVRSLVARSAILEAMDEPERAIEGLEKAALLGESVDDPSVRLCVGHSLILGLARIGRADEAADLLRDSWGLYEQFAQPAFIARRHWALGLVHLGLGAANRAAEELQEARSLFARHGYVVDTALVTLELAVALAEGHRWRQAEELAGETLVLLEGQPIHREALAAVQVMQQAAARRLLDRALGQELVHRIRSVSEQRPVLRHSKD